MPPVHQVGPTPVTRQSSPYQLYNEDCFETFKRIPNGSVDMVLCDLPYGTTACKWDAVIPFEPLWREYRRVCKTNAAIVLTASQPFTSALVTSNIDRFKYSWVWVKDIATGHLSAHNMPMKNYEDIPVFSFGQPTYSPQGLKRFGKLVKRGNNGRVFGDPKRSEGTENFQEWTNYPRMVLNFPSDSDGSHPTQKPFALMQYLVRTYTSEGDMVLDNCMGSGTTGVACAHSGRRFIGCDSDTEHGYFEIAETRIKVAYQQAAAKSRKS